MLLYRLMKFGTNLGVHTEVRVLHKGPVGHPGSMDPLRGTAGPQVKGAGTSEGLTAEKQTGSQLGSSVC